MLTTRSSETLPVPNYFKKQDRLDKNRFLEQFRKALIATILSKHPEQAMSPAVNTVAEQAWEVYLKVCDFFDKNQVFEGHYRNYPTKTNPFQDLDGLYFSIDSNSVDFEFKYTLAPRAINLIMDYSNNPASLQSMSTEEKNQTQTMINLPLCGLSMQHIDDSLINYYSFLISLLANTFYHQVITLIHLGANVNLYSPINGNTPLLLAVSKGWNHQDPR